MDILLIGLYFVLVLGWGALLMIGTKRHGYMVEPLDRKQYMLKDFYPVGFQFLELIRYPFDSVPNQQKINRAQIVYGERFGEYYFRINMAEKFTYALTCVVISPLLGPLVGNNLFSLFGLVAAGFLYYYAETKISDIIKAKEDDISRDFADMVSKLALLINAGMTTRDAWHTVATTGSGTVYDEMNNTIEDMRNGADELTAYQNFGKRCGVQVTKKFASMLCQNQKKGHKELVNFLKEESRLCWEEKKHFVKRKGEEASNKMMLPLGLILVGVFVMILVPVLGNMGI